ncbi:hypothetical protein CORC01_05374 [Colletotrichum orchidophilum]|uniref:N-acetyltransferase domain-containing protein n=1 Tax=Colletotrichum orchidophilum TaxID=1209926 RepID=A0A1G4BD61_9PEZI|nr:uncharacterized protein CORC01_05374 [Colletotrichum orchidophilum]OHE99333.1 hypothetical protein CORC01_05374 [Colletotrichum orchidophilum]
MRIREARYSEIGRLALIGARAFFKDDIYAHFYPQRSLYPDAFCEGISASLLDVFTQPGAKILVGELEDGDKMPPPDPSLVGQKIVGYLTLVRHGSPEQKAHFDADSPEKTLYRNLLVREKQLVPNKAIDQAAIDDFVAKQRLVVGSIDNRLEAVSFAILPEFQSMGYGLRFLRLCRDMANTIGVDLVADASKKGFPIYIKFGSQHIGDIDVPAKTIQADDSSLIHLPRLKVPVVRLRPTSKPRI